MDKEYKIWLKTVKIDSKPITNYTATYKNKEVHVYSIDDSKICINWYIDRKLIENPMFPKEIITEMKLFFHTLYKYIDKHIDKHLMYEIINTMKRYLPYLEDDEDSVRNIILNVEVSR